MRIPVRTYNPNGKLLFVWDTDDNIIEIVRKDEKIRIKLIKNSQLGYYHVLDRFKKNKVKN